jgi:hypothetical protein
LSLLPLLRSAAYELRRDSGTTRALDTSPSSYFRKVGNTRSGSCRPKIVPADNVISNLGETTRLEQLSLFTGLNDGDISCHTRHRQDPERNTPYPTLTLQLRGGIARDLNLARNHSLPDRIFHQFRAVVDMEDLHDSILVKGDSTCGEVQHAAYLLHGSPFRK